ncbi:unnamed protein product, partial [Rhizoctonia solani]
MLNAQDLDKGLNILCIDGGGVRGLTPLIILHEIMRRIENARAINIHPHEHFDVIAGTGTGGISACMLGRLQMPIDKAVREYAKFVKNVFKDRKRIGSTMYKGTKLQEALKLMVRETTGNEAEMMNNGRTSDGCKTVVLAMARHNMNASLPTMFRSYSIPTGAGPECTIVNALYATMAHPDLFKSIEIIHSGVSQSFVGGEIGCSNPLAHVLSEVKRLYPDRHVSCIISIGAGHARTIQVPNPSRWYRNQDAVVMRDMATDSERVAEEVAMRFNGGDGVYFRFNVDQGMRNMKGGSWEKLGETTQHTQAYLQRNETNQKLNEAMRASTKRREAVSTTQAAGGDLMGTTGFKRCPAPTIFYTGQENENTQVAACITGGKDERRVCVIYGLGGVGKTQLALNVIGRTWDEWDHIIYVDASSNEALEKSFKEFAEAKYLGESYKDAISWLESCGERWLVVFDSADTPSTNIRQYIPAMGRGGSVLITTRLPDLARFAVGPGSVCHLSGMSLADGTSLLFKVAASAGNRHFPDEDAKAAEELVKDFGCLALAIVHAGALIAHSPDMTTISKYRSLFLSQRQRMLEEYKNLPPTAKLDGHGDTVFTTWKKSYDQLEPGSRELLWLCAYFHYDGIAEEIFRRAAQKMYSKLYPLPLSDLESQARNRVEQYLSTFLDRDRDWDAIEFAGVVADLRSHSLIEFDRTNRTYHLHVLVHDWAKTIVPYEPEFAIECAAMVLSLSIDGEEDAESLAFKRRLGPHVSSMLEHSPNLGANHGNYFKEVYSCTGQWIQQSKLETQVLDARKRVLGEGHPDTLGSINTLAVLYSKLGQYEEAMKLEVQVIDARGRLLGEEHPDTVGSINNFAVVCSKMGRYDAAERLGVQVLDIYKQLLGEEHVVTLGSMNNLAVVYSDLGRYGEAEQLEVQVLDTRKRLLGEEHPDTLSSMDNLAAIYLDLGQHDKAEQLEAQVLDIRKRVLGKEHPDTLGSMNTLAVLYSKMGRYDEAEQLGVQVIEAREKLLGEEHPDTLGSINNFAAVCLKLGQYDAAEQLGVQVLDICKQLLGEEHPDTLSSANNLATVYLAQSRWNEAKALSMQVLDSTQQVLGEIHPHTFESMVNLGLVYSELGRIDEAKYLTNKALTSSQRVLGRDHPITKQTANILASLDQPRDKSYQLNALTFITPKELSYTNGPIQMPGGGQHAQPDASQTRPIESGSAEPSESPKGRPYNFEPTQTSETLQPHPGPTLGRGEINDSGSAAGPSALDGSGSSQGNPGKGGEGQNTPGRNPGGPPQRPTELNLASQTSRAEQGLNILCIDGGGVRGLSSLVVLREMMYRIHGLEKEDTPKESLRPADWFDLIAGTGTGGVSACMLGRLGMSITTAIKTYSSLMETVFSQRKRTGEHMYKAESLKTFMQSIVKDSTDNQEEKMTTDLPHLNGCNTLVFAMLKHNLNAGTQVMFRSYQTRANPAPDCTIWETLCATMAHPDFFKSIDITEDSLKYTLVSGELGTSNPLAHVLTEVRELYPGRHVSCIMSIGAGHVGTIHIPDSTYHWASLAQGTRIKSMASDSERVAEEMAKRFQGTGVYFRFNVDQGIQDIEADDWEKLSSVNAHTRAYLIKNEVRGNLDDATKAVYEKRAALAVEYIDGRIQCPSMPILFKSCPVPTALFTGWTTEIQAIGNCLVDRIDKQNGKNEGQKICILYGLGGAGKSQLALKVIEHNCDRWVHVIYVDAASSMMIEGTLRDFARAKCLGSTYTHTLQFLQATRDPWLLVFDNADDPSFLDNQT